MSDLSWAILRKGKVPAAALSPLKSYLASPVPSQDIRANSREPLACSLPCYSSGDDHLLKSYLFLLVSVCFFCEMQSFLEGECLKLAFSPQYGGFLLRSPYGVLYICPLAFFSSVHKDFSCTLSAVQLGA